MQASDDQAPKAGPHPPSEPRRPHRAVVWPLIVLASALLVFSIIANWVQTELLDTNQVVDTTDEIVGNKDIKEQLSIYAVNQLYANVDVQRQIANKLPSSAQALAAPLAAVSQQLAVNVEEKALATPQVQALVSTAVGRAQSQFVSLVENKDTYPVLPNVAPGLVAATGGRVTLEYGSVIANLADRLGVNPTPISKIQGVVQGSSTDLQQRLTVAQSQISSLRTALSQSKKGKLSPQVKGDLQTLDDAALALHTVVAHIVGRIKDVQNQVPAQLRSKLSGLESALSSLYGKLSALEKQIATVLRNPSKANVVKLDPTLATLQDRISTVRDRQLVQHPGQLVLMQSSQLSGLQTLVSLLRNLGFVLPVLVLLMYLGTVYLAKGWRRNALIAAGGGILGATLLILIMRRLLGSAADSLATSDAVKPAITATWDILSDGLRQRALFVLVIGLAFVGGGVLAGPGRHAVSVRRFLAPYLRDHPVGVYAVVVALFLLWLSFIPGINNLGQVLVIVVIAALALVGVEVLRRQTVRSFPRR